MIDGLVGYKLGMTQIFMEGEGIVPVTVLELGPCKVVQLKTPEKEGYQAVQISFGEVKEQRATKPQLGHFKKANLSPAKHLKEFEGEGLEVGQILGSDVFSEGDFVDVTGTSRGKGFQGVMKRHNYSGGRATHGSHFHRAPGSIGQSAYPSHVFKNKGMPGQMGNKKVTTEGLKIVSIRPEENIVLVKGAVPGGKKSLIIVRKSVKQRSKQGK